MPIQERFNQLKCKYNSVAKTFYLPVAKIYILKPSPNVYFLMSTVCQALNIGLLVCKFLTRIVLFNFHPDLLASPKPKWDL